MSGSYLGASYLQSKKVANNSFNGILLVIDK